MIDYEKFIKERNEALFSLDETKIKAYCLKYGVHIPDNQEAFWRGIHKAICHITDAPDELKAYSAAWLYRHGSSPDLE